MDENKWSEIFVDGELFLISSELVDDTWKIIMTNLIDLMIENLSREKIIDICQRFNPLLSIEDIDIDEIMRHLLNNVSQHVSEISKNRIFLQTEIQGGIFRFQINLSVGSTKQFWEEVTMPLCLSSSMLRRKNEILIQEIKKKDEEIFEYKPKDPELIRKPIETKPFSEDIFKIEVDNDSSSCIKIFTCVTRQIQIPRKARLIKEENSSPITSTDPVIRNIQVELEKKGENASNSNHCFDTSNEHRKLNQKTEVQKAPTETKVQTLKVSKDDKKNIDEDISYLPSAADRKKSIPKNLIPSLKTSPQKRRKKSLSDFIA